MGTELSRLALDRLACLAGRTWRVEHLPGGLTNINQRVVTTDTGPPLDLVVRAFGSDAGLLGIDRDAEHNNTARAHEAGVGPAVVEFRPELAMLVIEHLDGSTLVDDDLADPAVLTRVASAVRGLHQGPAFTGTFDMFARQHAYREAVRTRGFHLPPTYDDHATAWADVRRALAVRAAPPVPCNNDLLAANLIDDGSVVRLIDYEYAGAHDAFFELGNTATECSFTEDQTDAYLESYLGRPPTAAEQARVRLQSLVSEYGWSLWGFIQAATSPLDFDFTDWGRQRFEKASARFAHPMHTELLETVARG